MGATAGRIDAESQPSAFHCGRGGPGTLPQFRGRASRRVGYGDCRSAADRAPRSGSAGHTRPLSGRRGWRMDGLCTS